MTALGIGVPALVDPALELVAGSSSDGRRTGRLLARAIAFQYSPSLQEGP